MLKLARQSGLKWVSACREQEQAVRALNNRHRPVAANWCSPSERPLSIRASHRASRKRTNLKTHHPLVGCQRRHGFAHILAVRAVQVVLEGASPHRIEVQRQQHLECLETVPADCGRSSPEKPVAVASLTQ